MDEHEIKDCSNWMEGQEALEKYIMKEIKEKCYEEKSVTFRLVYKTLIMDIIKNKWDINVTVKSGLFRFCPLCKKPSEEIKFWFLMPIDELKDWYNITPESIKSKTNNPSIIDKIKTFFGR